MPTDNARNGSIYILLQIVNNESRKCVASTSQVTRVERNGVCSDYFIVRNGIKQGGVISPVLFCASVDGLLKLLSDAKVDCYIGHVFAGAFVIYRRYCTVGSYF